MDSLLQFLGTVIVAVIGLIGIMIQTKHSNKLEEQKKLTNAVNKNIDELRAESKSDDARISQKLDDHELNSLKRFLITEMTKIKNGTYIPSEEQVRIIHEAKDEYNSLGGDSYVDDMFEDLHSQGLL